jgi:tripartite-type tricarboxylate transporter receptor subunit TctC
VCRIRRVSSTSKPGKLSYTSSGNGSSQHLFAAVFLVMAGVQMTHVPYKGSGPALADLLSGQVPVSVPSISNALSHIQAGKLRALAVTSSKRAASLPDVPTLDEAGVRGYDAALWFCVLGPKGLPADVVTKLYESIAEALRSPEVQTAYATQGIDVRLMPPGPFADYLRAEVVKWARIVKESGATVD